MKPTADIFKNWDKAREGGMVDFRFGSVPGRMTAEAKFMISFRVLGKAKAFAAQMKAVRAHLTLLGVPEKLESLTIETESYHPKTILSVTARWPITRQKKFDSESPWSIIQWKR